MDCERIERDEAIEAYLSGRLSPDERDAFERHSSECPGCLERLRALRAIQAELWEQGSPAIPEAVKRRPVLVKRWAFASIAALLLISAAAILLWRQGRPPAGSGPLAALAEFQAPAYLPLTLRSGTDQAAERFRSGMERYRAGRYAEAATELRAAERLDPQAPQIPFFLGVCDLLTGRTDQGIASLNRAVSLGDTPYLVEARFYLAKAWLRKGDAARASVELQAVVDSGSRLADESSRLLKLIEKSATR